MELLFVILLILLFPTSLTAPRSDYWVIWNVGQGEWVTHVTDNRCFHFDMGGEKLPARQIQRTCGEKSNFAYFSHWDMDHVGFAKRARGLLPHLCLARAPLGSASVAKQKLFEGWPPCPKESTVTIWQPTFLPSSVRRSANEICQIYRQSRMLVTGDAPVKEEKQFLSDRPDLAKIRWLVLGHHGSRTSTSEDLLYALPNLQLAIASSRRAKYGHPHVEIERRLRRHRIPLLTTEEWGNILIRE